MPLIKKQYPWKVWKWSRRFFKDRQEKGSLLYYGDGEAGKKKSSPIHWTWLLPRNEPQSRRGDLEALERKLEDKLLYGEYLTEAEKKAAFTEALNIAPGNN